MQEQQEQLTGNNFGISWSGVSAGVGYGRSESKLNETTKEAVPNNINVAGDVTIRSEEGNLDLGPMVGGIGGKLSLTGKEINILDAISERRIDHTSKSSYFGVGINAGIPVISAAQQYTTQIIRI